jgi:hypothetical protein
MEDTMTEKKTVYQTTDEGGYVVRSDRKPWIVWVPSYIYDLWMPLIGVTAVGVYSVYIRLEMNGSTKRISQKKLAAACRIGKEKLAEINKKLQDCGFIEVVQPQGHERLMHWTTEIIIKDPPQEVSRELIDRYALPDHDILTPWLMGKKPEPPVVLPKTTEAVLPRTAKIGSLGLDSSEVGSPAPERAGDVPHGTDAPSPISTCDVHITQYADHIICPNPACECEIGIDLRWRTGHPFRKDPHCDLCGTSFVVYLETDHNETEWAKPRKRTTVRGRTLGESIPGWEAWLAGIIKGSEKTDKKPLTYSSFEGWTDHIFWSAGEFETAQKFWKENKDLFLRKLVWSWGKFQKRHFNSANWITKAIGAYNNEEKERKIDSSPPRPKGVQHVPF